MTKSHVLTVNHVFELMLLVSQGVTWKSALEQIIPQRKVRKDANGADVPATDGTESHDDDDDNSQDDRANCGEKVNPDHKTSQEGGSNRD